MNEPVFSPDIQRRIWRWEQSTDGTNLMFLGVTQEMHTDLYLPIDEILDRMQGWE